MPAARVIKNVVDRSNYVPASAGVSAFLALDAVRGPSEAVLVTNQREFIERFTGDGEVARNLPVGYFTALAYLAKSNSLYIRRVNGAGVEFASAGGDAVPATAGTLVGEAQDEATMVAAVSAVTDAEIGFTLDGNLNATTPIDFTGVTSGDDIAAILATAIGVTVTFSNGAFTLTSNTTGAVSGISDLTDAGGTPVTSLLGLNAADNITVSGGAAASAESGDPALIDRNELDAVSAQSITSALTATAIVGNTPAWDEANPVYTELNEVEVSFFAADGGAWANGWQVSMVETPLAAGFETDKAYTITVTNIAGEVVESFLVSFNQNKKNNFGDGIYFADVLKNSRTILVTASAAAQRTDASLPATDANFVLSAGSDATGPLVPATAIAALNDGDGLDIRLWLNGGYTDVGFQKALVAKAEEDCESFAILTVPYDVEQSGSAPAIVSWAKDTLNVNSTQASAPIAGWLEIAVPGSGLTVQNTRFVSPDGYVAANLSQMMTNQNWWDIVAGFDNGILTAPISVLNRWSQGNLDTLVDGIVNPIASFSGEGIVLWGQRTATPFPTALDRMNVSLLLMFITVAVKRFLRPFLFRPNVQSTLDEIESGLVLFGDNIKANLGVYDYRVEIISTDADKDNYCATVNFYVEPVKGIEKIVLNEVVVNTGELS